VVRPAASSLPFGVAEILDAVAGAERVLDVGCGSGRLTVALALAGAAVTGFDTSASALADARKRADDAGVSLTLVETDMNEPLPFADRSFDAVTSRLALMVADDPVATLRELARALEPGGRIVTALWSTVARNPWFAETRAAVAATLGTEHGAFARAFGRLGEPDDAARLHAEAGLVDVEARLLEEHVMRTDAAEHWRLLATENGHFRRVDAMLDEATRAALVVDLASRLERFAADGALSIPRTLVLATARTVR
jgi:SAM-dependent methyltransferase